MTGRIGRGAYSNNFTAFRIRLYMSSHSSNDADLLLVYFAGNLRSGILIGFLSQCGLSYRNTDINMPNNR